MVEINKLKTIFDALPLVVGEV